MRTQAVARIEVAPVPPKLTKAQQRVLDVIKRYLKKEGMPPTRAEISRELGHKSPSAAESVLRVLERRGVIRVLPRCARGIQLV